MTTATTTPRAPAAPGSLTASHLGFVRHATEMIVASWAGMALGGIVGIAEVADPGLQAVLWLLAMSLPMAVWMRFRGHPWSFAMEMTAAMATPSLVLLPLFWLGTISGTTWIGAQHCWMVPAMLAWMVVRRRHFGW